MKDELQAFINAKILGYEQLGDKGKSRYLRRQLAAMGVEMDHEWNQRTRKAAEETCRWGRRGKEMTPAGHCRR